MKSRAQLSSCKERHDGTERPVVPSFHKAAQTCRLSSFFVVRSGCCNRRGVNRTPHTSHFSQCCTTNDTHTRGSSRKFGVRTSHSMCHPHALMFVCLILFDFSVFLSLLTLFTLIILSFLLAINFILLVDSHFMTPTCVAQVSSLACAMHIHLSHASSSRAHVTCLILRDSPFLFLLSTFSPMVLFIYLDFGFFFHDVVDKFPVHFS